MATHQITSAEFKVQCDEVLHVMVEVPRVVLAEIRERHWSTALTSWQEDKDKLAHNKQQLCQNRVRSTLYQFSLAQSFSF